MILGPGKLRARPPAYTPASNDVTVALTGQSATFTTGTLTASGSTQSVGFVKSSGPGIGPFSNTQFKPSSRGFTVNANVTIALTGQSATFTAGLLSPATAVGLTGQAATFAAGTLSPATSKALTGQSGTFAPGTMTTGSDVTVSLTGQVATFTPGALVPSLSLALTGGSASFATGNLLASTSRALSGQAATFAPGAMSPSSTRALTGISASFTAGTLTPLSPNVTVGLTGQAAGFSAGSLAPSSTIALTGSIINAATGTITPLSGVVVALTGQAAVFTAGTLSLAKVAVPYLINLPLGAAANLLNSSTLQVGTLTYAPSTSIALGSVIIQNPVAGVSVLENSHVALQISSGFVSPTNDPVGGIKLPNLPNKILPPDNQLVDERGVMKTNWWRFLLNVSNQAMGTNQTTPATITIGASPFEFTTPAQGTLLVSGGPVTLIEYSKDAQTWYPLGVTQGQIQMAPNDHVRITYMNPPTLTFFPR